MTSPLVATTTQQMTTTHRQVPMTTAPPRLWVLRMWSPAVGLPMPMPMTCLSAGWHHRRRQLIGRIVGALLGAAAERRALRGSRIAGTNACMHSWRAR